MVPDLFITALFSAIDLAKGSLLLSIPAYLFALAFSFLRKFFERKYGYKWLFSSLVSTYAIVFSLVLVAYAAPYIASIGQSAIGEIPAEFQPTIAELAIYWVLSILRLLAVAGVIAFLLLPLELIGVFIFEKVGRLLKTAKGKSYNYYINLYIATLLLSIIASFLFIFLFPWAITGIIYLVWFGLG